MSEPETKTFDAAAAAKLDVQLPTVDARIYPRGGLAVLSREEVARLRDASPGMHDLLRRCALAVLTSGSHSDDPRAAQELYPDFDIQVLQQDRGIRLDLSNAPAMAFVDGQIIRGVAELLFAVVRDLAYTAIELSPEFAEDLETSEGVTDAVFRLLRNAHLLQPGDPNLVVCWGGHSINRVEYDYTKRVGYQLGLRGLDICTGCGPGAMKGPMKGANIAHAKQRKRSMRYIGITEPGIIAAESPNPIVNHLVIMPDIEKRLEAFVRLAHTIVVFPGGVGTVEEVLYLFSILMHPANAGAVPLVFAGPENCRDYFEQLESFLVTCFGERVKDFYQLVVGDPGQVGRVVKKAVGEVHSQRRKTGQAYYFNWDLEIDPSLQVPFLPSHENMASLNLSPELPSAELASQLRRAFSGLVAGNVKAYGIEQVKRHGPYRLQGDVRLLQTMDALLRMMVRERRMKLGERASDYRPCYRLV
ncbi:MAG: nucleotide 5'-monophosphate nucleosidase PpnN [Parahaliea sp.]